MPKRLVRRAFEEDSHIVGNVIGHAKRYEEPDEPESEAADMSILRSLILNKQGHIIGSEGVLIARLVEENAKELAGRICNEEERSLLVDSRG